MHPRRTDPAPRIPRPAPIRAPILALIAALAAGLLGATALAQVGEPPEALLDALRDERAGLRIGGGGSSWTLGDDLGFRLVEAGGLLRRVEGSAAMTPANRAALATLIGAATGYGGGIAGPVGDFLEQRLPELEGAGPVALNVEEYLLELEVAPASPTGEAAPTASFGLELRRIPAEAFPEAAHARGPEDARFVVREFSDFQCPFCARYALQAQPAIVEALLARGDVRVEFHHFPLLSIHANAVPAAEAAECVAAEGGEDAFWTFHDALFERQRAWQDLGDPAPYFVRLAREVGAVADEAASARVEACIVERRALPAIEAAYAAAVALGLNSTPTVMVEGFRLADPYDLDAYLDAIARSEAFAQGGGADGGDGTEQGAGGGGGAGGDE